MDHNTIHIIVTGDIHGRFHASDPVTATPVPGSLARVSGYVNWILNTHKRKEK